MGRESVSAKFPNNQNFRIDFNNPTNIQNGTDNQRQFATKLFVQKKGPINEKKEFHGNFILEFFTGNYMLQFGEYKNGNLDGVFFKFDLAEKFEDIFEKESFVQNEKHYCRFLDYDIFENGNLKKKRSEFIEDCLINLSKLQIENELGKKKLFYKYHFWIFLNNCFLYCKNKQVKDFIEYISPNWKKEIQLLNKEESVQQIVLSKTNSKNDFVGNSPKILKAKKNDEMNVQTKSPTTANSTLKTKLKHNLVLSRCSLKIDTLPKYQKKEDFQKGPNLNQSAILIGKNNVNGKEKNIESSTKDNKLVKKNSLKCILNKKNKLKKINIGKQSNQLNAQEKTNKNICVKDTSKISKNLAKQKSLDHDLKYLKN